jgi:hypothetical protein
LILEDLPEAWRTRMQADLGAIPVHVPQAVVAIVRRQDA